MSFLDEIKIPLAEMVTGNSASYQLLQEALYIGNFIIIEENECYRIRPLLRSALQKRARNTYDSEKIREIYYNAGLYYEMQNAIQAMAIILNLESIIFYCQKRSLRRIVFLFQG